jgi:hypothetical protein
MKLTVELGDPASLTLIASNNVGGRDDAHAGC